MGRASTRTVTDRTRSDQETRATVSPPDRAMLERDPRHVLGNRSTRVLLAQPKLTVGASFDPLEIEADRVAADVVRSLATATAAAPDTHPAMSDHACGAGCAVHGGDPTGIARSLRRMPSADAPPIGAAGGEVRGADESEVNRARGGGAALPEDFRTRVESVMGADLSGVRVHTGSTATQLNRSFGASAFTIGNDIFFRDGMPDVRTNEGAHLVSHELTHTIQQGGAGTVARCSCGSTDPHVMRHSSFEHLMLGNVKPEDLARIGSWQNAIEQTKPTRTGVKAAIKGKGNEDKEAQVDVVVGNQTLHIDKPQILHVLLQELIRLKDWQKNPPGESSVERSSTDDTNTPMTPVGADPNFQVYTVRLPQGLICTYGEMNTLADYFGSVEVLRGAKRANVKQLLQSVREETWVFLSNTYDKVAESLTKQEQEDPALDDIRNTIMKEFVVPGLMGEDTGGSFKGAQLFGISSMFGQLELIGGIQKTGAKGDTNKYTPSLGRNACHFVPESWNAWADNHKKARALADQSFALFQAAERTRAAIATAADDKKQSLQEQFQDEKRQSVQFGDEAMMTNGFGDHYLQDSYAAGHMINKTQIMQFYIEYIDRVNQWDYFKNANWRKVQNIAYGQVLAPPTQYDQTRVEGYNEATGDNANKGMDPQSVENRSSGNWRDNFEALGLKVPPSLSGPEDSPTRKVLHWMRAEARGGRDELKGSEIISLMAKAGVGASATHTAVAEMLLDGVLNSDADVDVRGRQMAKMRNARQAGAIDGASRWLPLGEFQKGKYKVRPELRPAKGSLPPTRTEEQRQDDYKSVVYQDYLEFIQSSFLQKSTNALHDTFCKGGLTVYDKAGTEIGRVYGDDAMFSANSAAGVAHSGTTSQMSRDAIVNILNTGGDGGNTVQAIVDRFPTTVRADVYNSKGKVESPGVKMDIQDWHNSNRTESLKNQAMDKLFPTMNWKLTQKMAPGAAKDLGTFFTSPPSHRPF